MVLDQRETQGRSFLDQLVDSVLGQKNAAAVYLIDEIGKPVSQKVYAAVVVVKLPSLHYIEGEKRTIPQVKGIVLAAISA